MTKIDLGELRRLLAQASPEPWWYDVEAAASSKVHPDVAFTIWRDSCPNPDEADANGFLIAAARNALPALLEIAEAAHEVCRSIPADYEGPGARRHANALNRLRSTVHDVELSEDNS